MAVFVLLVGAVNPMLKTIGLRHAFSSSELLAIAAIGMVGCVVPASGVTGFLIGVISTPVYFATPENRWSEFYHPNLDAWVVPVYPEALRSERFRKDDVWVIPNPSRTYGADASLWAAA